MIQSIWKIEFITAGGTRTLLDYGDLIEAEIPLEVSQTVSQYAALHSPWGETAAEGGALVRVAWTREELHASHAALRAACLRAAATFPSRETGKLRLSIEDGEVWDIADASISSGRPVPVPGGPIRSFTAWQALGGQMTPAAAITLYAGIPWEFILQDWTALTGDWDDL